MVHPYLVFDGDNEGWCRTHFWDESAVSFCLGGAWHTTSIARFGVELGVYTEDEIYESGFYESTHIFPDEEDRNNPEWGHARTSFWNEVGTGEYNASRTKSSKLKDPLLRYIHRLLSHSLGKAPNYLGEVGSLDGAFGPPHGLLDLGICASMGMVTHLPNGQPRFQDSKGQVWDPEDPEHVITELDIQNSPQRQHSSRYEVGTSSSQ
ncbi:hypothetical protein L1987_78118 [Smallanthus sonchifolius]|uniref:Uncharacterized protein n=1 Tax=Smallanthus sonchifolius TaxID=185202 RepID=A0ACB8ZCU6_9ASTR|nr:hypothetical protein L1987_78118 [Smallanthus sonchifolius]